MTGHGEGCAGAAPNRASCSWDGPSRNTGPFRGGTQPVMGWLPCLYAPPWPHDIRIAALLLQIREGIHVAKVGGVHGELSEQGTMP